MSKKILCLLCVLLSAVTILAAGCGSRQEETAAKGYSVRDAQGMEVKFDRKPQRILTLSMSTDAIVLGLVRSDRLAAVNALLDDPSSSNIVPLAKKISRKITNPSVEEIFAMQPDLVIIPDWGNAEIADNLRDLGLKVVVVKGAGSLKEIKECIAIIAAAIGEPEKGRDLIGMMDVKLAEIAAKVKKIPKDKRKNVALVSLMTSYGGAGCSYDEACGYAGVINGLSAAGLKNGQRLTKELLVKINPDLLLMPAYNDHGNFDREKFISQYIDDPSLQPMKAIREKNIVYPREGYIYNVSQDFVFGVQEIARCAYGKDFDFPDNMHLSVSGEENR